MAKWELGQMNKESEKTYLIMLFQYCHGSSRAKAAARYGKTESMFAFGMKCLRDRYGAEHTTELVAKLYENGTFSTSGVFYLGSKILNK